jgi:hypothetical protein
MKPCGIAARMLAAALFGLGVPASTTAADGSNPAARTSAEYRDALDRADRDYARANRRCEVLPITERKLCVSDSARAREAARAEDHAGAKQSRMDRQAGERRRP